MTSVTVVVPAYNEGSQLAASLVTLSDHFAIYSSTHEFNFVIVDDGSADETREVALRFARFRPNVCVLEHERNLGLGAALRNGFAHSSGEFTVVLDADLSYHPSVAMQLLEYLELHGGDIAVASPYLRGGTVENVPFLRRILSREANRILSLAANGRYATFTCMVRAYRTSFLKRIAFHANGMENSAEILLVAIRKQAAIVEIPARLCWSEQRRAGPVRLRVGSVIRHTLATLRLAFTFRPSLWLAVPGLFPGLLPLVVAVFALAHAKPSTLALAAAVTVGIQYSSLAIFAGQLGSFFARATRRTRKHKPQGAMYS